MTNDVGPEYEMQIALTGFEQINRYWDKTNNIYTAKILPGEYYVTIHDEMVTTVLGSCISACIRDKVFGIGGMNHFMLPEEGSGQVSASARYGNHAMEQLINEILKSGGKRKNLEVKLFGGGQILENMTDIGMRNIRFVKQYIKTEGLVCVSEDLSDIYPRKVNYYPASGKVRMKKLRALHNNTIVNREFEYKEDIAAKPQQGDVELF
jgi:chemotaxis protein CheD